MAKSKELVPGVSRLSRSQVAAHRKLYKGLKKSEKPAAAKSPATIEKSVGEDKNGGKRLIPTSKAPCFYPVEDVRQPKKTVLFNVNGVPLQRVNQAYVIATTTKVELDGVKIDDKINDTYFAKAATKDPRSAEAELFEGGEPKAKEALPESKSADQKEIDKAILSSVKKTAKYLKASWGLSKEQFMRRYWRECRMLHVMPHTCRYVYSSF
ncbi:60S ribosomal protein L6 [Mycena maculata]|uniref:60S ribosomal protein L6 n=1 Tax=Mycena maculata TaxID=230809 RepID=A0AAD7P109_9AGAR|nr:60S ribosomal protein L6 [Mycena maculata]